MLPLGKKIHGPGRHLSKAEIWLNELSKRPAEQLDESLNVKDTLAERGGRFHMTAPPVVMWKPLDNGHWDRKLVPSSNVFMNLKEGFKPYCPDCDTDCGTDPNECPARADTPIPFRRCPVCAKPHYDPGEPVLDGFGLSAGEINDDTLSRSTPESRTLTAVIDHMNAYHPKEAREAGVAYEGRDSRASPPVRADLALATR